MTQPFFSSKTYVNHRQYAIKKQSATESKPLSAQAQQAKKFVLVTRNTMFTYVI